MIDFKHVLIPTDGSPTSAKAAKAGIEFARRKAARSAGVPRQSVVELAVPVEGIPAAAHKRKCDAIFTGSHGRRGLKRLLLGSVTSRVLATADRPVIVYR